MINVKIIAQEHKAQQGLAEMEQELDLVKWHSRRLFSGLIRKDPSSIKVHDLIMESINVDLVHNQLELSHDQFVAFLQIYTHKLFTIGRVDDDIVFMLLGIERVLGREQLSAFLTESGIEQNDLNYVYNKMSLSQAIIIGSDMRQPYVNRIYDYLQGAPEDKGFEYYFKAVSCEDIPYLNIEIPEGSILFYKDETKYTLSQLPKIFKTLGHILHPFSDITTPLPHSTLSNVVRIISKIIDRHVTSDYLLEFVNRAGLNEFYGDPVIEILYNYGYVSEATMLARVSPLTDQSIHVRETMLSLLEKD